MWPKPLNDSHLSMAAIQMLRSVYLVVVGCPINDQFFKTNIDIPLSFTPSSEAER